MLRYAASRLASRSDHPLLFGMFIAAVVLLVAGFTVEQTTSSGIAAGFLTVSAVMTVAIGVLGYSVLALFRAYRKWVVTYK